MINKNKILKPILYLGWVFAFILLWFRGCESDKIENKTNVVIRDIKGSFEPVKDINHKKIDTVYLNVSKSTGLEKYQNDIYELYNENETLKQAYFNETDSLKRELMYLKAIQLKEFMHEFDNDTINIVVKGIAQGEVKSLQPFYTIKQKNSSEVKFRLLGGGGIGINKELNQGFYKINLGFQNKKGNIFRGSYLKIDNKDYGVIEYDFSIFSIKK